MDQGRENSKRGFTTRQILNTHLYYDLPPRPHFALVPLGGLASDGDKRMSRSGYSDDCEFLGLYRASVDRALAGKRGQTFLRELINALDSLPEKKLIAGELMNEQGKCCAIGAVCKARQTDVTKTDYEDPDSVARLIGVARCMAAEIAYMNDEYATDKTPEDRWQRMRDWAVSHLQKESQ
jgi:hypothetical protein